MKIVLFRLFLIFTSLIISINLALWISETYFFDKFYYYKSIAYGYWVPGKKLSWKDFGKRGQDLISLTSYNNQNQKVLGAEINKNLFTVAVIGDSYVWGQGLKEEDRFVDILEKKLNTIYPSRVISLGNSGDELIDNYVKYVMIKRNNPNIDLYIFGIASNDLVISGKESLYNTNLHRQILSRCPEPFIYAPRYTNELPQDWDDVNFQTENKSVDYQYGNSCIFRNLAPLFPRESALYYSYLNPNDDRILKKITEELSATKHIILYPGQKYLLKYIKKRSDYYISKRELHFSYKANQMFAQQLFDYIVENGYIPK